MDPFFVFALSCRRFSPWSCYMLFFFYITKWFFSCVNILQWHHDVCHFHCGIDTDDLWAWYEACKLIVLVVPSSGASERVFSLLKQYWGMQQPHSLSDPIMLSLYLSYNKRHVKDFIHWENISDCFSFLNSIRIFKMISLNFYSSKFFWWIWTTFVLCWN